ncbi:PepSY-associated TM helix domain-containing protein [Croceibacterium aestuarii]|uniref:PepSY-associated TM helix domain-containing protein n=1 Tax=Croceibacterium aestuarii TaxID=3064139 RepID=UPI00272DD041|nr:PepSY-associated TM helix domain-containing protein [Croceibacterium sp. D39]
MASANSTSVRLRRAWFQVHKWIGLALAILIIPLCLTGSALVWDEWVNDALNPQRSAETAPRQSAAFYADAARKALEPGETLLSLTWPEGEGAVMATAAQPGPRRGRPVRTQIWLDPADGHVLDKASSGEGAVRFMHILHGSLMIPGVGRQIVGWIGVAMLISALSGLWLWWPFKGGLRRGLRWKRMPTTSGNLHHQGGFWIAIPLAILSFTGAWISFPAFFGAMSGDADGPPRGFRGFGAAPVEQVRLSPDAAIAAARPLAEGPLLSLSWPTRPDAAWTLRYEGLDGPVTVADATGQAMPPPPAEPESTARLMRRIHDGNGMPVWWQVLIFLGGLVPVALAVTGVMMWLRGRRVKGSVRAAFVDQTSG